MIKKALFIFFVLIYFVPSFAALNSILAENHFSYPIIEDLMLRKLIIAPEIYKKGSIITRKDMAVLSVMLLTNTDDRLYMERLTYYDIKNILNLVIEFSDEINFLFSSESTKIEERIRKFEKRLDLPVDTKVQSKKKKMDMPEYQTAKIENFVTKISYDFTGEYYDSNNKALWEYFNPEKGQESTLKNWVDIESVNPSNPANKFNLHIDTWYRDSGSDINAWMKYYDKYFSLEYSDLVQDDFFFLNKAGLSTDYFMVDFGKMQFVRRMNSNDDINDDIFSYSLKNGNVSFLKRKGEIFGIIPGISSDINQNIVFFNGEHRSFKYEAGIAQSTVDNISANNDSIGYSLAFDRDDIIKKLNVNYIFAENLYLAGDNINNYRSYNTPSSEKTIMSLDYYRRFNDKLSAAVRYKNDENANSSYITEDKGLSVFYNIGETFYQFNYLISDQQDLALKAQSDEDTVINLTLNKQLFGYNTVISHTSNENTTLYKNIIRKAQTTRVDFNKFIDAYREINGYAEVLSHDSQDAFDNDNALEDINSIGFELQIFSKDGKVIKLGTDFSDSSGLKNYTEGKFYAGLESRTGNNSFYEFGVEMIDHSGKKGDGSFDNTNLIMNYRKKF
ncbi:MAG: hypothetical protein M0R46_04450 [Candidatus Muirbacterium halophilum]|nr:hypothetical protein [Candidatus Muirbacterium halophilum]